MRILEVFMLNKVNRLENNYNLIKQYYRELKIGLITAENYNEKKILILEDITKDFRNKQVKGKTAVHYANCTYFVLTMLYEVIKAITKEDYEHYTEYV